MEAFADANTFGMDDYQYLSDTPVGVFRSTRRLAPSPRVRRRRLLMAGSTAGALAILLFCRLTYNAYERLGGDFDKLAERRDARERAAHDVRSTVASPEAAPLEDAQTRAGGWTSPRGDPGLRDAGSRRHTHSR